jgi:hypothetical protein
MVRVGIFISSTGNGPSILLLFNSLHCTHPHNPLSRDDLRTISWLTSAILLGGQWTERTEKSNFENPVSKCELQMITAIVLM